MNNAFRRLLNTAEGQRVVEAVGHWVSQSDDEDRRNPLDRSLTPILIEIMPALAKAQRDVRINPEAQRWSNYCRRFVGAVVRQAMRAIHWRIDRRARMLKSNLAFQTATKYVRE